MLEYIGIQSSDDGDCKKVKACNNVNESFFQLAKRKSGEYALVKNGVLLIALLVFKFRPALMIPTN